MKSLVHKPRFWFALAVWLGVIFLGWAGYWQGTAANPQVQVPMFYDAHYLFPRPWTQEQTAPGVPHEAAVALHGRNHLTQPITVGMDGLALLAWNMGDVRGGQTVLVSLTAADGRAWGATLTTRAGWHTYRLALPPLPNSAGQTVWLTVAAPQTTADQPVTIAAVGGDRLGGSILLNEYSRPGNMALRTYGRGHPAQALAEQFLPALFRLRLQQYRAAPFKGALFPLLAVLLVGLTAAFVLLAGGQGGKETEGRGRAPLLMAHCSLLIFLVWQLVSGRLLLWPRTAAFQPQVTPLAVADVPQLDEWRVVDDLPLVLWTADRAPEKRWFVLTDLGAIGVPADSQLRYNVLVPPHGRLRLGWHSTAAHVRFVVRINETVVMEDELGIRAGEREQLLDLSAWAGQVVALSLETQLAGQTLAEWEGETVAYWVRPQLETQSTWLAPYAGQTAAHTFTPPAVAGAVGLLDGALDQSRYAAGETAVLTLRWHAAVPTPAYPTIFVHLLNATGDLVAQWDAPPVQGAYPVANWQPNALVTDAHTLPLPADLPAGTYTVVIGLYEPSDFTRWAVDSAADGRVVVGEIAIGN